MLKRNSSTDSIVLLSDLSAHAWNDEILGGVQLDPRNKCGGHFLVYLLPAHLAKRVCDWFIRPEAISF